MLANFAFKLSLFRINAVQTKSIFPNITFKLTGELFDFTFIHTIYSLKILLDTIHLLKFLKSYFDNVIPTLFNKNMHGLESCWLMCFVFFYCFLIACIFMYVHFLAILQETSDYI